MEQEVVTVGLDLAKNVFQVHAIGADGAVLIRRKLRRTEVIRFFAELPRCLVGMEACASAHHWGRLREGAESYAKLAQIAGARSYLLLPSTVAPERRRLSSIRRWL